MTTLAKQYVRQTVSKLLNKGELFIVIVCVIAYTIMWC